MKNFKIILIAVILIIASSSYAQKWQDVTPVGYVYGIKSYSFINNREAWLCVHDSAQISSAQILHTSNACIDWDTCYTFAGGIHFSKIQMTDSLNGYGAGGYGLSVFWRTNDGGHTW